MPDCRIIVGGPHPTALPIRTLEEIPELDFCCAGEGEDLMVELAQALSSGGSYADIAGLAYRVDGGGAKANPPRPFNRDLDRLPPPARHLLPMSEYTLTATRTQGSRFCPTFIVARGCPYTCSFCAHPIGLAHRSIPNVIAEIREVVAAYDTDQINIEADTLTANRKFVTELCNALIEADLGVRWTCGARVDRMDEDILRLMKKAGCWQASYGVETGSQRLLEQITKGITKDRIRETFRLTKKVGIKPRAFFMINLPGETLEETYETIRFAQELDPLWANFTITIPYPGTPMYDELLRAGKIRHFRWSEYNTWSGFSDYELPFVNDGRTEAEIKAMQKKALKMFYMRPAPAMRFLRSITTLNDVKKYARGLVTLLAS